MTVAAVWTELGGIHVGHGEAASPDARHVLGEVVGYEEDEVVALHQPVDHLAAVDDGKGGALTMETRSRLFLPGSEVYGTGLQRQGSVPGTENISPGSASGRAAPTSHLP